MIQILLTFLFVIALFVEWNNFLLSIFIVAIDIMHADADEYKLNSFKLSCAAL